MPLKKSVAEVGHSPFDFFTRQGKPGDRRSHGAGKFGADVNERVKNVDKRRSLVEWERLVSLQYATSCIKKCMFTTNDV